MALGEYLRTGLAPWALRTTSSWLLPIHCPGTTGRPGCPAPLHKRVSLTLGAIALGRAAFPEAKVPRAGGRGPAAWSGGCAGNCGGPAQALREPGKQLGILGEIRLQMISSQGYTSRALKHFSKSQCPGCLWTSQVRGRTLEAWPTGPCPKLLRLFQYLGKTEPRGH